MKVRMTLEKAKLSSKIHFVSDRSSRNKNHPFQKRHKGEMYRGWPHQRREKGFTKNLEEDESEGVQGHLCGLHLYISSNYGQ